MLTSKVGLEAVPPQGTEIMQRTDTLVPGALQLLEAKMADGSTNLNRPDLDLNLKAQEQL